MEEQIKLFLSISYGYGDGSGDGSGYGYGDGSGDGSGYGYGDGDGDGDGYGSGDGDGYGSGSGYGYGYGYGVKSINGDTVYMIDNISTIIKHIHGNVAEGYILNSDLTLTPTFVVKGNNMFAHGNTLHDALQSLQEKLYDESSEEERLEAFRERFKDFNASYPAKELFHWHHVLTGSCRQGREAFCSSHNIDIDKDEFTIHQFINLTKDSYGGKIVRKLEEN